MSTYPLKIRLHLRLQAAFQPLLKHWEPGTDGLTTDTGLEPAGILTTLHWLPVCKRVMFKTVVLVWKCLNGTAAGYLSELCVPVASASGRQHLRSASTVFPLLCEDQ